MIPGVSAASRQPALVALIALGTAAVASGLLARFLPVPPGDAFHGTLAFLPLLLAGFALLQEWTARLGGRRIPARVTAGELAALGVLVLLALARARFHVPMAEAPLAAGFLLVLAHRLTHQLLAARPLLGDRLPSRPSPVFFFLPLLAYLAILPWSAHHRQPDGDEPYYLLITHSLAYDFDADLTNNYAQGDWRHFMERPLEPQPGDPVGPRGERYSRHNEMLPLTLVPAYWIAGKLGALATLAAVTAALAWATLRLARHYVRDRPGETLVAYALVAFTPPLLLYSYQVWVEVPATLLAVLALDRILALDGNRSWGWREWLGIGLTVLLLPLVKIRFMLIAAPLLAMGWFYAGRPRRPILLLGIALGAVAGGILLYNQSQYANPLKIHSWQELDPHRYSPSSYLAGGLGLFWDTAFGLFGAAPVWLIVLPAALLLLARRHRLLVHLAVLTVPYLLVVAPRSEWYGGWSPPFRYALIALPLLGIALVPLLASRHRPGARALLAGLGALTLVLALVWVVVPGWTYNFADGRTYALDRLSERTALDFARFFPSSVRLRPATWIWPPLSFALVSLIWWLPRRGKAPALRRLVPIGAAGLAGITALLAAAALLPAAADRVPTRVVELEDFQVWKSGGHLHPDRWVIERTFYRGGWVLRVGETLKVPVTPGGDQVRLTLQAEHIRNQPLPFTLDLMAGDRLLASWTPRKSRVWEAATFGPFPWHDGEPLVVAARGPHVPGHLKNLNGAILDRVAFEWQ